MFAFCTLLVHYGCGQNKSFCEELSEHNAFNNNSHLSVLLQGFCKKTNLNYMAKDRMTQNKQSK